MSQINISIETGNAAFEDGPTEVEVGRILRELATKFEDGGLSDTPLRDINGNRVGEASISND